MRKRNKVKQLGRTASHRKAMLRNMAVSLFDHERVVTSRAKGKVLRSYAERLITKARNNLDENISQEKRLHNTRLLIGRLADKKIINKLCNDIAPRYKERNGGYTRIIHLPDRLSDGAKMSIIELVDRKEKVRKAPVTKKKERPEKDKPQAEGKKSKQTKKTQETKPVDQPEKGKGDDKSSKKGKWFWGFKKKKGDEH